MTVLLKARHKNYVLASGTDVWRRNSEPWLDKSVHKAMSDKRLLKTLVEMGTAALSEMVGPSQRERELERMMASIKLEQAEIQSEKMKKAAMEVRRKELEDHKKEIIFLMDGVHIAVQELNRRREAEFETIRQKYVRESESYSASLADYSQQLKKIDDELNIPAVPMKKVPTKPIMREVIVRIQSFANGANELYAYIGPEHGVMAFNVLNMYGPSNTPTFTCQLIVDFPTRARPLRINMVYTREGSKKDMKNDMCGSLLPLLRQWVPDLTICGDIEANPGPSVHSKMKIWGIKNPNPGSRTNLDCYDLRGAPFMYQTKSCRQNYRRDINRHKKGSEVVEAIVENRINDDNIFSTYDAEFLPQNRKFQRQIDEKKKYMRMIRDYSSKHQCLKYPVYSGDLIKDCVAFHTYLNEHGYASNSASDLPPSYVREIFEKWCRDGKLIDVKAATILHKKLYLQRRSFELPKTMRPQYRARKLMIRAFVAYCAPSPLHYLQTYLNRSYQLDNNSVTLKDVIKTRQRIERKNKFRDIEKQMYTNEGRIPPGEIPLDFKDSEFEKPQESWIGGTLRSAGRRVAEGIMEGVMPILDKAKTSISNMFASMPSLGTCLVIVKIVSLLFLVAVLGWAIITLTSKVCLGVTSFIPCELGECTDLSNVTPQAFNFVAAKSIATSWAESVDMGLSNFNKAFSDSEIVKLTKKMGDFSSALKNIEWLGAKLKEITVWVINSSCKLLSGRPFFQDARNVVLLQSRIKELIQTVTTKETSNMTSTEMEAFIAAFQDLVEMYPFVFRVDSTLGGAINLAIAKAGPLYRSCCHHVKTNITRMEPFYIALEGDAGTRKTYLMDHLNKMIFDCMRVMSPNVWKELFFRGKEPHEWNDTMHYSRQAEQEYWDGYNAQPITKIDDLGQSLEPEKRAAEFFSVIRMINNEPYPLHMAELLKKESTVFRSFLLVTSTNMNENLFRKKGELMIVEPIAYLRRRDYAITVSIKDDEYVKEGVQSKQFLDKYILQVHNPSKKTGALGPARTVTGYEGLIDLVNEITRCIIHRHNMFTHSEKMDHTSNFASTIVQTEKNLAQQEEMLEHVRKFQEKREGVNVEEVPTETTGPSKPSLLGDFFDDDLPSSSSQSNNIDGSDVQKQMFSLTNIEFCTLRNFWYGVHPSSKLYLEQLLANEKIGYINSYDDAQLAIQKFKNKYTILQTIGWEHEYIVHGIKGDAGSTQVKPLGESRVTKFFKYNLGFFKFDRQLFPLNAGDKIANADHNADLYADIRKEYDWVMPWDIDYYNGLTSRLYWDAKHEVIESLFRKHLGIRPMWYDDIVLPGYGKCDIDLGVYEELIMFEIHHEKELRASRGKSTIGIYVKNYLMVVGALALVVGAVTAAVMIYRTLDPSRKIDDVYMQSSDPRLTQAQRGLARARALPKIRMHGDKSDIIVAKQMNDDNARSLLPILRRNLHFIRGVDKVGDFGHFCMGIEGSIFLTTGHFMERKPQVIYISEVDGEKEYEFSIDVIKSQYVRPQNGRSTADLCLLYVPMTQYVKTITHLHFFETDDLQYASGLCREDRGENVDGKVMYELYESSDPIKMVRALNYGGEDHYVDQLARIKLSAASNPGDCVKPYIFFNPKVERKIGLYHIGLMGTGEALAGRLNQEDVERFKKYLAVNLDHVQKQIYDIKIDTAPMFLPKHQQLLQMEYLYDRKAFDMNVVGQLNFNLPYPTKTNLVASCMGKTSQVVIDGEIVTKEPPFPVEVAPARLRPFDDKDPMNIALTYTKKRRLIYRNYLRKEDYNGIFTDALRHATGRFLDLWEVLKGVRNNSQGHSVKRSTSAGFYHKIFNKLKREYIHLSKAELKQCKDPDNFIDVGHDTYLHKDILELVIMFFRKLRDEGSIPLNWVIAMLKDEPRPWDRVLAGKTRVFFAGNFAFMIISRMIFGEFVAYLEGNWMDTDITIGCNPYSSDWRWIYHRISALGRKVKDDDTRSWDQHFPVFEFVPSFTPTYIEHFKIEGDARIDLITEVIVIPKEKIIYAVVICNFNCGVVVGKLVFVCIFQASGVDLTTILNSICNSAINRCLIRLISGKSFDEVAVQWVNGDDLLLNCPTVSRELLWKYAKIMFDHTRTAPSKNDASEDSDLDEAYFLQRQFKFDGVMMCPLNIRSINGMLQWIEKSKHKTLNEQFAINCKIALAEASRHGEEVYNKYLKEINIYLRSMGPTWVIQRPYALARAEIIWRVLF